MPDETKIPPLAEDFYLFDHRLHEVLSMHSKLGVSDKVLNKPAATLVRSVFEVIAIYGNFPAVVKKALEQAINPLFSPEDYYENVYISLRVTAIKEGQAAIMAYAEALYNIRKLFVQEADFFKKNFKESIDNMEDDASYQDKQKKLGKAVQKMTHDHIKSVCKEISAKI